MPAAGAGSTKQALDSMMEVYRDMAGRGAAFDPGSEAPPGEHERCRDAGVYEFVTKPVRLNSLRKTLQKVLSN